MNQKDKPLKVLGQRIRQIRIQQALSQEELAHLAELDRSYIGQIERGERNLYFSNLYKIARALDLTVSELLEGV